MQCGRTEEKDEEMGEAGGEGGEHERVSLAERSLSISQQAYSALHPPPLNESHNKASSVCVVSSSIHVPRGKHSPSFFNSPLLSPPSSQSHQLFQFEAFGELLLSKISSLTIRKCEYI